MSARRPSVVYAFSLFFFSIPYHFVLNRTRQDDQHRSYVISILIVSHCYQNQVIRTPLTTTQKYNFELTLMLIINNVVHK